MRQPLTILILSCVCALSVRAENYRQYYDGLPFEASVQQAPSFPERRISVKDFGAAGDGIHLDTQAIQSAIDSISCSGGGHVDIPAGIYLTGPFEIKSYVDLHLDKNAIVVFSTDKTLYPRRSYPYEKDGSGRFLSPVSAYRASAFAITGEGVLDGNGEVWRPVKRAKVSDTEWQEFTATGGTVSLDGSLWYPWPVRTDRDGISAAASPQDLLAGRPCMIRLMECQGFLLEGVTVQNSPRFHVHLIRCDSFIVDGIRVRCPWNAQNGDGIDLGSSTNGLIVNCTVDVGDDAICLKSSGGLPTRNIVVDGCTVFHGHGGFVIGSETSGGVDHVAVRSCRFLDTDTGLRFKSLRGKGGTVSDVYVQDIYMQDIANYAIWFDLFYQKATDTAPAPVTPLTPVFRDIRIRGISCHEARKALFFNGLPETDIQNITIENSVIDAREGATFRHTRGLLLKGLALQVAEGAACTFENCHDIQDLSDNNVPHENN